MLPVTRFIGESNLGAAVTAPRRFDPDNVQESAIGRKERRDAR
jgi:hypothetical protein